MSEASILQFASTGKSVVKETPSKPASTGELVHLFGNRKCVQDVPEVVANNALAARHMKQVVSLFNAALKTCEKNTKDMTLSRGAHCELTKHALMGMIEFAFEQNKARS